MVDSFFGVTPSTAKRTKKFDGWSEWELSAMCEMTDSKDFVATNLFGDGVVANKRYTYVKSYEGAASVLDEIGDWRRMSLSLEEIVGQWSGGVDAAVYVMMMKGRLDATYATMTKQRNMIDIYRAEAKKEKDRADDLARRLRFAKKGII